MPSEAKEQPIKQANSDSIEIVDENLKQGFAQAPRPVLKAKGLSLKAKTLYVLLLDYAWQEDNCFPGQPRLAEDLDISVDTVQRALNELRQYKLVDWKQRGLNQTNVYYILRLSDNPYWSDGAGNRKLRFQETAARGFKKPQGSGTKNTQGKNKQRGEYSESSTEKSLKQERYQSNRGEVWRGGRPRPSAENMPRASSSEPRPIGQILGEAKRRLTTQRARAAPSSARPGRKKVPDWIGALVGRWSVEFHDDRHIRSNISQLARLYARAGLSAEAFRGKMFEARRVTLNHRRSIRKKSEGSPWQENAAPYFFACLRELLGDRMAGAGRGLDGRDGSVARSKSNAVKARGSSRSSSGPTSLRAKRKMTMATRARAP